MLVPPFLSFHTYVTRNNSGFPNPSLMGVDSVIPLKYFLYPVLGE